MQGMRLKHVVLLLVMGAFAAYAENEIQTREDLFAPITDPILNPMRHYAELDLNGDGTNDLLLSESVSLGGTGGLVYNFYLGLGQDRFTKLGEAILAGVFAIEAHGTIRRLWWYHHMSSQSGLIQYWYFDHKGAFHQSTSLMIYPGDMGSEVGNAIYHAIFNDKTDILKLGIIAP